VGEILGRRQPVERLAAAGRGLIAYVAQRPEYRDRFRKLGSYLATKVLVGHLRNRQPRASRATSRACAPPA